MMLKICMAISKIHVESNADTYSQSGARQLELLVKTQV